MAKKVMTKVKLQLPAGQATPAPPVGTALGPHGINIAEFTTAFNEQTKQQNGTILPVLMTIYEDRSFDFIIKKPPAAELIKKAMSLSKGSGVPNKDKVGKLSDAQLTEIAEIKMEDLNARDVEHAKKIIAGTARSMGVETDSKKSK